MYISKKEEETRVYQYRGNLFSGDEVTEFNMNYWINPDRSELFFARKVILVEGQTDKIVLSYLAKNWEFILMIPRLLNVEVRARFLNLFVY